MTQNFGYAERNAIKWDWSSVLNSGVVILALLYERKEQHTAFRMNHIICRA